MPKVHLIAIFICLFAHLSLLAQEGKKRESKESEWLSFQKKYSLKQYDKALPELRRLLSQNTCGFKPLFFQGAVCFEALAERETQPGTKKNYQDSALFMYDRHIQCFGDTANALNRKGIKAMEYLPGEDHTLQLMALYKEIYSRNGENILAPNLLSYGRIFSKAFNEHKIAEEQLRIALYLAVQLADNQVKKGRPGWLDTRLELEQLFYNTLKPNCNDVARLSGGRLIKNKKDLTLAKQVYSMLLSLGCPKDSLFAIAAETIAISEPSYASLRRLASEYTQLQKYAKAQIFLDKALLLAGNNRQKSDCYSEMAFLARTSGNKINARAYALKSLAITPSDLHLYDFIAELYLESEKECIEQGKQSISLVYFAAYTYYEKAGNSSRMEACRQHFPSVEQMFEQGLKEGQELNTGCWIQEKVKIRHK